MKNAPVRHRVEHGLYLTLKGFLRALPHAAARGVGEGLGALAHRLDRRHREIALRNLALAFPEMDEPSRRTLVAACFRHFGGALTDLVSSSRFTQEELCRRFSYEGWENLDTAATAGRGVFILSAHLGYWEMAALPVGLYKGTLHVVARLADNPYLERELANLRTRFGNGVIHKHGAARRMLQILRDQGRIAILIDQRVQEKEGIAVPFFGHEALTTPVLARMSLRTGTPVVACFGIPTPGGTYRFVARPPIFPEGEGEEAVRELTRRYLGVIEEEIRRYPELWLWMHRRWDRGRRGGGREARH
ncbi:MAG: Kdo2-lipid lauroyltransferase/acyltransferase [Acidobacteriota bacterium]|jgi:KDO2-lipid IV(A) lauroyltransferase|nr:Kdo2-lipid lauroyltransferase/acyltransferase [Acidobacteriota bacterium]